MFGIESLYLYIALVVLVALQRLWETRISARNEQKLRQEKGAVEHAKEHFVYMKLLHTIWLFACVGEAYWRKFPPSLIFIIAGLALLLLGQILRITAIKTLDGRWTVKIIVIPDSEPVTKGIYRYIRHPNYLGVVIEIFALPIIFGCWYTAVLFTLANALLLVVRIRAEEKALDSVSQYKRTLPSHRFIPSTKREI